MKLGYLNKITNNQDGGNTSEISYIASESLPEGYTDISTIENWDKSGKNVKDYIFVRYEIQLLLIQIVGNDFSNWGDLTAIEKQIVSKHILAPYALRLTIFSDEEDKKNWNIFLENSEGNPSLLYKGRALIIKKMRKLISENVRKEVWTISVIQQIYKDILDYTNWYIKVSANDLIQWITNEVGSDYENEGFAQKSYYSELLRDDLINIYNGIE